MSAWGAVGMNGASTAGVALQSLGVPRAQKERCCKGAGPPCLGSWWSWPCFHISNSSMQHAGSWVSWQWWTAGELPLCSLGLPDLRSHKALAMHKGHTAPPLLDPCQRLRAAIAMYCAGSSTGPSLSSHRCSLCVAQWGASGPQGHSLILSISAQLACQPCRVLTSPTSAHPLPLEMAMGTHPSSP